MLNKTVNLLKKDFLIEKNYKFVFVTSIFSTFFSLLIFFFIDRLYGQKIIHYLEYSTGYFGYVFISLLLFNYTGAGLGSISQKIRLEKIQGTFESVINNEKITMPFLFSMILFNFMIATLETLIYIITGIFILNIDFKNINFLSMFISFILSVLCFSSIGIISSCFIILFRRGNPIAFLLNSVEGFFGGVYFPVTVLPIWGQFISRMLPITYAIKAIQKSVYASASISEIKSELVALFVFSIILFPLSVHSFKKVVFYSKKKGNLGFY